MSTQTVTKTADVATLATPSCKEGGSQTVASFSPTGVACQLVTEDDRAVRHTFTPEDVRWQLIAQQRLADSHGEDYGEDLDPRQWEEEDRSHWEEGENNWASHMWESSSPSAFVDDLDRYFAPNVVDNSHVLWRAQRDDGLEPSEGSDYSPDEIVAFMDENDADRISIESDVW